MYSYDRYSITFLQIILSVLICSCSMQPTSVPKDHIMSPDEFKQAINNNLFLKQERRIINEEPLKQYELAVIQEAIKYENAHFGGIFDIDREINNFKGDTLVVGGGKRSGLYYQNQGKTLLIDIKADEVEIETLIKNISSGQWNSDTYNGKKLRTNAEKKAYIKLLKDKLSLYKKAFKAKNNDTLARYYSLNIEEDVSPDMLGSITSEQDMQKIPNQKFMHVEFENVPCPVLINPKLYPILERITKPGGTIKLKVPYECHRLIVPVIQSTKYGKEFTQQFKNDYRTINLNS